MPTYTDLKSEDKLTIEAWQVKTWQIVSNIGSNIPDWNTSPKFHRVIIVDTPHGKVAAKNGDWILKYGDDFWVEVDEKFHARYVLADIHWKPPETPSDVPDKRMMDSTSNNENISGWSLDQKINISSDDIT